MDPRGFPTTLPEFQKAFPNDSACADYLIKLRWPNGFVCPKCGSTKEPRRRKMKSVVFRCRACESHISLTAGTVMEGTHTPLSTWFWGAYLVTTMTPGMSALQFQRQLGISRYETAFQILHKLRAAMFRPERDTIGGEHVVELDETFVGGRTRGEGRGKHHKAVVVGAVEIRTRALPEAANDNGKGRKATAKNAVYAGRLRLTVVEARTMGELTGFVKKNVTAGSVVQTDGAPQYDALAPMGFLHDALPLHHDPKLADAHLPMIHRVFANLKTWLEGTHHGVSQQHLQAYLNEFVFRFNRRFYPMTTFNSVLGIAVNAESATYDELYSGAWVHAA